jgi:hypothetical protein
VRGAIDLVPTFTINGGQLSAEYVQASQFAASPFSTSVTLMDRLARNHATSSSQTIETSTGVHTAIVTTML